MRACVRVVWMGGHWRGDERHFSPLRLNRFDGVDVGRVCWSGIDALVKGCDKLRVVDCTACYVSDEALKSIGCVALLLLLLLPLSSAAQVVIDLVVRYSVACL